MSNNLKITLGSKELPKAINFISSIADMFSAKIGGVTQSDNILLEANKGKLYCVYAKQGVFVKVRVPATVESDGYLIAQPTFLSTLPNRAKELSIELNKDDENSTIMKWKNGSSAGNLVVSDDKSSIENNSFDKSIIPTDSVTLNGESISRIINNILFDSSDERIDKKIGLPVTIKSKKGKAVIQTNDAFCAVICNTTIENDSKIDIITQGLLLQRVFSVFKEDVEFSSNESVTRLKGKNFEVIGTTSNFEKKDIVAWLEAQEKPTNVATIKTKDICGLIEDVIVVSKLANIDPIISLKFKKDRLTITNASELGKSFSVAKASYKKEEEYRFNGKWFSQFASKLDKGEDIIFKVYGKACVISNEKEDVKCIVPMVG